MKPDLKIKESLLCLTRDTPDCSHFRQVEKLVHAGASFIQLRSKSIPESLLLEESKSAVILAKQIGCKLIINDHYEMARDVDADGVHLGVSDAPVEFVRDYLLQGKIIGKTVHSIEEAKIAVKEQPDYIGLGPVRNSITKKELTPCLSDEEFKEITALLHPIPVFLIGGLNRNDFDLIDRIHVQGICLCSDLSLDKDDPAHLHEIVQKSRSFEPALHSL
jgi:thiamine-phosphate pyrophosphorylase